MSGIPGTVSPGFVHASAVAIGEAGILIRGVPGAGKSVLAEALIEQARRDDHFARLIGDDRIQLRRAGAQVVIAGHPAIVGRIERRGIGIVDVPSLGEAVLRLVIDLVPVAPLRLPEPGEAATEIAGVTLPRLAFRERPELAITLPLVMARLPQYLPSS